MSTRAVTFLAPRGKVHRQFLPPRPQDLVSSLSNSTGTVGGCARWNAPEKDTEFCVPDQADEKTLIGAWITGGCDFTQESVSLVARTAIPTTGTTAALEQPGRPSPFRAPPHTAIEGLWAYFKEPRNPRAQTRFTSTRRTIQGRVEKWACSSSVRPWRYIIRTMGPPCCCPCFDAD